MLTELITTPKRRPTELLLDIERDKQPILITQHGMPSAYLVDVETFELRQQGTAVLEGPRVGTGVGRGSSHHARGGQNPHGAMPQVIGAE